MNTINYLNRLKGLAAAGAISFSTLAQASIEQSGGESLTKEVQERAFEFSSHLPEEEMRAEQDLHPPAKLIEFAAHRIRGTNELSGIALTYFAPDGKHRTNRFETPWSSAVPFGPREYFGNNVDILMYLGKKEYLGHIVSIILRDEREGRILVSGTSNLRNKEMRFMGDENLISVGQLCVPMFRSSVLGKNLPFKVSGRELYSVECYINDGMKPYETLNPARDAKDSLMFIVDFEKSSFEIERKSRTEKVK